MRPSVIFFAVVAAGCASSPATEASTKPRDRILAVDDRTGASIRAPNNAASVGVVLAAPIDEVWNAVVSSYAMLKVPVAYVNRPGGEQGNRKFIMSRTFDTQPVATYLNCGEDPFSGANANSYPVTVSLVTRVRPQGTSSVLETILTGQTYKASGNTGAIYCASTGSLELHIAEMVASRLTRQ